MRVTRSRTNRTDLGAGLARVDRMNAELARATLMSQHDGLRTQLDRCRVLARRLLAGTPVERQLDVALSQLRIDFVAHNATETTLVGGLLRGLPTRGPLLITRMLEEHLAEHSEFWEKLAGTARGVALRIDDLAEELEGHMAAEERTFLSPRVLRSASAADQ